MRAAAAMPQITHPHLNATMTPIQIASATTLAMLAFASNSLLCRLALRSAHIDAVSFTSIRLISGAVMLAILVLLRRTDLRRQGSWTSAAALFIYAAAFSYAYVSLTASTGALLLFGAVQATMIGKGLWSGERFSAWQSAGLLLATAGLVGLVLPGLSAPSPLGASLMVLAGVAWGVYSLRGRGAGNAGAATAANFLRTVPMAVGLSLVFGANTHADLWGVVYAVASGALASGLGYAIWYQALPHLRTTSAATVQLSVPVIAAIAAVAWLGEDITLRLVLSSWAIVGGIYTVLRAKRPPTAPTRSAT